MNKMPDPATIYAALKHDEGYFEQIRLLLERYFSSFDKESYLQYVLTQKLECAVALIKLMLYNGADPNYVHFLNPSHYTHLFFAVASQNTESDKVEIIRALVKAGAKADQPKDSSLSLAVSWNVGLEVVKLLLSAGADLFRADSTGDCPLFYALKHFNVSGFRSLLDLQEVDINIARDKSNVSLLHRALRLLPCTAVFVKFLIDRGIDVNSADEFGNTPLHEAVKVEHHPWKLHRWEHEGIIEVLLRAGALVSAKNKDGFTPLDIVIEKSSYLGDVQLLSKYFLLENPNFDVEDKDIEGSLDWLDWVESNSRSRMILYYAVDCKRELQRMNSENVGNGRTLLEFLQMYSGKQMSRNGEYGFNIDFLLQEISENRYPLYSSVISSKFARSLLTDKLEECNIRTDAENQLETRSVMRGISLNFDCACALADHLDETDLLRVILTFCK